jgi:hypothetical protein
MGNDVSQRVGEHSDRIGIPDQEALGFVGGGDQALLTVLPVAEHAHGPDSVVRLSEVLVERQRNLEPTLSQGRWCDTEICFGTLSLFNGL